MKPCLAPSFRRCRLVPALALLALLAAAGCAPLQPYRTRLAAEAPVACNPSLPDPAQGDGGGRVPAACKPLLREDADAYSLHFVEFDDQGWPFPREVEGYGDAWRQSDAFFEHLRALLAQGAGGGAAPQRLSVVVFVHGWKHTAEGDDANVRAFRLLLASLDEVERLTECPRKVVGLYVGWRGAGLSLGEPFENLTFYSRKSAAQKVAQGNVRVVFSKLRALQDVANAGWNAGVQAQLAARGGAATAAAASVARGATAAAASSEPQTVNPCDRRLRLSIAGHSFGGLIVYTALAQSLIKDVVELRQAEAAAERSGGGRPPLEREGDLVVVINPAIEATRYDPLHRAVAEAPLPHYHPPLFVAITSADDQATRDFFPLGRGLSSLWERYPDGAGAKSAERDANLNTFGQSDAYLSHDLGLLPASEAALAARCAGWIDREQPLRDRLRVERRAADAFDAALADAGYDANAPGLYPRVFCSTETLRLSGRTRDLNSPLWNIRTGKPIVNDHGDIGNPRLTDLLRQLYMDTGIAALQRQSLRQRQLRQQER